jgi:hypothetical protein
VWALGAKTTPPKRPKTETAHREVNSSYGITASKSIPIPYKKILSHYPESYQLDDDIFLEVAPVTIACVVGTSGEKLVDNK